MRSIIVPPAGTDLPDHTRLPATDTRTSDDFRLRPQAALLLDSLQPVLKRLHSDHRYLIGVKVGIHWREGEEPLRGCKSPDWYYVPNVPPMPPGTFRHSYVLWKEKQPPQVVLEFVSGDGEEEHDPTPETGKFWVYEQAIRAAYYGIFDSARDTLEVYRLVNGRYQRLAPNARGRYFLPPLGVELGLWHGHFAAMTLPWLRWWDAQGNMLLTGHETAEQEMQAKERAERQAEAERRLKEAAERQAEADRRAKEAAERQAEADRRTKEGAERRAAEAGRQKEQARSEAEESARRAERLAEKLRALGIDPDS